MTTTTQSTTWPDDAMTADDLRALRAIETAAQRLYPPKPAASVPSYHQPAKRAPRAVQTIARTIVMLTAAAALIGAAWLGIVLMVAAFG